MVEKISERRIEHTGIELVALFVIGTDCVDRYKYNYLKNAYNILEYQYDKYNDTCLNLTSL